MMTLTAGPARARFGFVLMTLSILLVGTALLDYTGRFLHGSLLAALSVLLLAQVLIVAVLSVPSRRRGVNLGIRVLVAAAIVGQVLCSLLGNETLRVLTQLTGIVCFAYVIVVMLRFLMQTRRVDRQTIYAAISVYLLMGLLWTMLYVGIERLEPGAFATPNDAARVMGLGTGSATALFFSFVTLTTLGYGDVTPVTTAARMAAVLEALTGQVYLVILVARLVGLNVAQHTANDPD